MKCKGMSMSQEQSVNNKAVLQPYKTAMTRYFRSQLTLKGMTYPELSKKLAEKGLRITSDHLRNKVGRGLISADLFILLVDVFDETDRAVSAIHSLAMEIEQSTQS